MSISKQQNTSQIKQREKRQNKGLVFYPKTFLKLYKINDLCIFAYKRKDLLTFIEQIQPIKIKVWSENNTCRCDEGIHNKSITDWWCKVDDWNTSQYNCKSSWFIDWNRHGSLFWRFQWFQSWFKCGLVSLSLKCDSSDARQTTWRSGGSAHSFVSAFLDYGMPCGKILERCQGTWRLLMKRAKNQISFHFNQTCSKLMNSQNMLCVEVKNTSNEGNPRQESFMNGRQKRAEAPWSYPFSTLQILSLYFSCVHGNGWIHKHTKSSWTL